MVPILVTIICSNLSRFSRINDSKDILCIILISMQESRQNLSLPLKSEKHYYKLTIVNRAKVRR